MRKPSEVALGRKLSWHNKLSSNSELVLHYEVNHLARENPSKSTNAQRPFVARSPCLLVQINQRGLDARQSKKHRTKYPSKQERYERLRLHGIHYVHAYICMYIADQHNKSENFT